MVALLDEVIHQAGCCPVINNGPCVSRNAIQCACPLSPYSSKSGIPLATGSGITVQITFDVVRFGFCMRLRSHTMLISVSPATLQPLASPSSSDLFPELSPELSTTCLRLNRNHSPPDTA